MGYATLYVPPTLTCRTREGQCHPTPCRWISHPLSLDLGRDGGTARGVLVTRARQAGHFRRNRFERPSTTSGRRTTRSRLAVDLITDRLISRLRHVNACSSRKLFWRSTQSSPSSGDRPQTSPVLSASRSIYSPGPPRPGLQSRAQPGPPFLLALIWAKCFSCPFGTNADG